MNLLSKSGRSFPLFVISVMREKCLPACPYKPDSGFASQKSHKHINLFKVQSLQFLKMSRQREIEAFVSEGNFLKNNVLRAINDRDHVTSLTQ